MLANFRSPHTSTIVQRLIDHGCIILGKTNTNEFAMEYSLIFRKNREYLPLTIDMLQCGELRCIWICSKSLEFKKDKATIK
jgi:hypothetical protein